MKSEFPSTGRSETARKSYNRMSRWYDLLSNRFEKKFRNMGLELLDAKEDETLLEIGFGTGHSIVALARAVGGTGMVYGIDISDGMLQIAKNRVLKAGLTEATHLERGDAMLLPFKEEFFDAIFMSFTLELFHSTEIPVVLGQCRRVLKKDGRICVVSLSKKEQPGFMIKLYLWAHHRFPGLIDCRPIYIQDDMEEAGFLTTEAKKTKTLGFPVEIVLSRKSGGVPASAEPMAIELQPAV
jgi:demethylmenaquinone methyltransferase/2-methoxy-6-polyprenyl-1,4-benzoquinol methylase